MDIMTHVLPINNTEDKEITISKIALNSKSEERVGTPWTQEEEDFVLFKLRQGLSYTEIAELLGRKTGGISSRIKVIAKKLLSNKSIDEIVELTKLSRFQVSKLQNYQSNKLNTETVVKISNYNENLDKYDHYNIYTQDNYKNKSAQIDTMINELKNKMNQIENASIIDCNNKEVSIKKLQNISIHVDILIGILRNNIYSPLNDVSF